MKIRGDTANSIHAIQCTELKTTLTYIYVRFCSTIKESLIYYNDKILFCNTFQNQQTGLLKCTGTHAQSLITTGLLP